jgi:hypothetical protein
MESSKHVTLTRCGRGDVSHADRLAGAGSSAPDFPLASRQEMTVNIKGGLHLTAGVGRANWLANLDDLNRRTR